MPDVTAFVARDGLNAALALRLDVMLIEIALADWPMAHEDATHFTSVMRWQGFREAGYGGANYGQRDKEFPKFIDLPKRTAHPRAERGRAG